MSDSEKARGALREALSSRDRARAARDEAKGSLTRADAVVADTAKQV